MTLGDLADYVNGRGFRPDEWSDSGLPIIRIQNLTDPTASANHFAGKLAPRHYVDTGDLLVSWSATLDVFRWNRGPAALNQHIFKVVPRDGEVDDAFLYFVLKSAMERLRLLIHGSTMKHITKPRFEALAVSIPSSIPDQEALARELAAREAAAISVSAAAKAEARTATALVGAMINDSLGLYEPAGRLVDVLSVRPRSGWSPVCDGIEGGTPVLTLSSVTGFEFRPSEYKLTSEPVQKGAHYWAEEGDLLISRSNTAHLVGHVAYVEGLSRPMVYPDLLMRMRPDPLRADARFIHLWLMSATARRFVLTEARGSSGTMKKITKEIIEKIPFPSDMSVEEQTGHLGALGARLVAAREVASAASEALSAAELLPAAVVRDAFDIDTEPALSGDGEPEEGK